MTTFAIFANGTFWGNITVADGADPIASAANEFGTDGNTDGIEAHAVTAEQAAAVEAWWQDGAPASECPIDA